MAMTTEQRLALADWILKFAGAIAQLGAYIGIAAAAGRYLRWW